MRTSTPHLSPLQQAEIIGWSLRLRLVAEIIGCAMSTPLPKKIHQSAARGELKTVVKWLRKGGAVDALGPPPPPITGQVEKDLSPETMRSIINSEPLLHTAARNGHLEMVRELLKRGASVDLPSPRLPSLRLHEPLFVVRPGTTLDGATR